QGTPKEIFESPQKPKTQAFVFKIRSFEMELVSQNYDFYALIGGIENFCFRNAVSIKMTRRLPLVVEELVRNTIMPLYGNCKLTISYSEAQNAVELSAVYNAENENALDKADELSAMIIEKSASKIEHSFDDTEKCNILKITF
ncbi:MAG: hypothetical protein LBL93_06090, partial [Ruminococcus sp.]|nr:hypothetical protein [Ruminococcus sp.]